MLPLLLFTGFSPTYIKWRYYGIPSWPSSLSAIAVYSFSVFSLTYKNDVYSGAIDVYDLIKYLLPAYVSIQFCFFVADLLSIVLFDLSEFYFWSILLSGAWSDQIKVVVTFFIWICCRENVPNDINYLAWWTSLSQNLVVLRLWFECSYPSLILATKREMGSSYPFLILQPNKKRGRTLPSNQTWDGIIPSLKRGMILSHPMLTPNQTHP